ncbi:RES family NAD+ phosphorylase [Burkholderia cenocepacia]|uniref:RES family NAD+ phosphorylase n=1 Tax=Burkholderia cenocepacia TaxID=95486 RepID=UPI0029393732|nr:RES family NAD+ phosphorylase [Burkholderia cenocepacia]MDV3102909.1 RES family NAD+ phosphorylase [Burkholderia cenocepacia]
MTSTSPGDSDDLPICVDCIGDDFLSDEIRASGCTALCSVCGAAALSWGTRQFAERIFPIFKSRFVASAPESFTGQSLISEGLTAAEVIQAITKCSDDRAAESILESLRDEWPWAPQSGDDDPLDEDLRFNLDDEPTAGWSLWSEIEEELRTRSRYFNPTIETRLQEMFADVETLPNSKKQSAVRAAGPGTDLCRVWRMRVLAATSELSKILSDPERELGPPPEQAAGSGRMNARGISVFYGATDVETCVGEVRAPVGACCITAAFDIVRDLRLLDISLLAEVETSDVSHFDPNYQWKRRRAVFLQHLSRALQVPVLPGNEGNGYLPSQMVAEFLGSRRRPRFDGVVFPSIQSGGNGTNVVLFHHASVVQPPPPERQLELGDEEPDSDEIWVFERSVPVKRRKYAGGGPRPTTLTDRIPTLRLVTETISIVDVRAVEYTFDKRRVGWMGQRASRQPKSPSGK